MWIRTGVERVVPLSATSLADAPAPSPPPCRLSVASVERLLAVVTSLPDTGSEEKHGEDHPSTATSAATGEASGAARAAPRGERAAESRGEGCPSAGSVGDIGAEKQGFGEGEMGRRDEGGAP